jgi:hypothetical protein
MATRAWRVDEVRRPTNFFDLQQAVACSTRLDGPVAQPLVGALKVIVGGVFIDCATEVAFAQGDYPVQALGLDREHEPLGVGIEVGTPRREVHRLHTHGPREVIEGGREERITVVDEVTRVREVSVITSNAAGDYHFKCRRGFPSSYPFVHDPARWTRRVARSITKKTWYLHIPRLVHVSTVKKSDAAMASQCALRKRPQEV